MRKFTLLLAFGMLVAFRLFADNDHSLIPYGSTWKYVDNGSNQGTSWQTSAFDDSGWKSGPAILGYGNPAYGERKTNTTLGFGPNPNDTYITTYFRKTIKVEGGYESYKASVKRDDGVVVYVNGVEVYRNNMPNGKIDYKTLATYANDNGAKGQTFTIKGSAFTPGDNVVAVEVHQHSKSSSDLTFDLDLKGHGPIKAPEEKNTLVPYGAVWKYLDNGKDQGMAWRAPSFDDASWKAGPAILGYGNPPYNHRGEATVVSYGGNPKDGYITTYFRKTIDLAASYESYQASVKRDDGVVVYVNGVEVFRDHMPKGEINYKTRAIYALDNGMEPQKFTIKGAAFAPGKNVIAVEVHQHNNTSSDLTFDFELIGKGPAGGDVTPPTVTSINRLMPTQQLTNASAVTFRVLFSEVVIGVDITDFALATTGLTANINTLTPVGTDGKTFDVNVNAIAGSGTLGLNLKATGTGISDVARNAINGGYTGQTYTIDQTPPNIVSLKRQSPPEQATSNTAVSLRAIFSEAITGLDAADFTLALTGTVAGTISKVTPAGTDGKTYDIDVNAISGNGTLGLNLNSSGTGVTDLAGNALSGGLVGETYTINQSAPGVLSINRQLPTTATTNGSTVTFRTIFSEEVTGVDAADFALALTGSANGTISGVAAVGADGTTYDVTVNGITGTGTLGLNLKASGTGIADKAGNAINGGFTGQAYTIDKTAPTTLSINRQSPATETTNAAAVTFRATFSEAVTGVDAADFALALTGTTGTIGTVTPFGTGGTTYDIAVTGVGGNGKLGLNLKTTGTGIADVATNAISGGFTGQTYTIQQVAVKEGFATITPLTALNAAVDATKEKQQAKVFTNAGSHFAVLADGTGTNLYRLDGTTWTKLLLLSTRTNRADAIVDGNLTHVLMYGGSPTTNPPFITQLITLEYVAATKTYKPWTTNPNIAQIPLDAGVETASLAKDGNGRLWVASAGVSEINVRYSDAPYSTWSGPVSLATGVADDDIAAAVYIPALKQIGVLWSDQTTKRFGFKTHNDGAAPGTWSANEIPGAKSAIDLGRGMADDHLNMKVAANGTVYAAVKTSYDTPGATEIGLLIRRPNGVWDNLYEVAKNGAVSTEDPTLPLVVLNETIGKVRVIYTSKTNGGDILYKESSTATIAFGNQLTLISGVNNNVTSTHQNFTTDVVILASNATQVVGVLASDAPARTTTTLAEVAELATGSGGLVEAGVLEQQLQAYPNPFNARATLSFALPAAGEYSLTLYESATMDVVYEKKGQAQAGEVNRVELEGAPLARGFYFAKLQTPQGVRTLRLVVNK